MKRWKPTDKPTLPSNDQEFLALETCKAFHYPGWMAWLMEAPYIRARLMAHELEKNAREGYEMEVRLKKAKSKGSDDGEPREMNLFTKMKANWGLR